MNDVDIFGEYCSLAKLGHRLETNGSPPQICDFYARYIRRARAGVNSAARIIAGLPEIYTDFVTNPGFNARSFKHRDRYAIAFFDGVPVILIMVLYRMLADRQLFREVGNPESEASDLPKFTLVYPSLDLLFSTNPQAVVPKDPKRLVYAIHVSHLVFDFLSAHEITHIAHGHVDYNAVRGNPFVNELEGFPSTFTGNCESQAMELDADSTASRVLVNTARRLVGAGSQLIPEIAELYNTPEQAMFDIAVAVCITFRLFQDSGVSGVDLSVSSHPPTRWRQWQILQMMGNDVGQLWDQNLVAPVSKAFTKALEQVETAFEAITGTGRQVQGLHDASQSVESVEYTATLTDCWNNSLRRKLGKYAFIEPNYYEFERPTPTAAPASSFVGAQLPASNGESKDERGRGPEIVGTRLTVFHLLPSFLDFTVTEEEICRTYSLTPKQVAAARAFILNNPETVLAEHLKIEERLAAKNPPEIIKRAQRAQSTFDSYKQYLAIRQATSQTACGTGHERLPTFREWLADREKR